VAGEEALCAVQLDRGHVGVTAGLACGGPVDGRQPELAKWERGRVAAPGLGNPRAAPQVAQYLRFLAQTVGTWFRAELMC